MVKPVESQAHAAAQGAIARAASATGVDFALLVETARRESTFDPRAQAATSSARGMFQFVEGTWLDMVRRHGADHGLGGYAGAISLRDERPFVSDPALRREILALRDDPETSARMAGELTRENAAVLSDRLGRTAAPGELYAAHVLGAAGAARLIAAAGQGAPSAAALFPREASANPSLFYVDGAPVSAAALLDRFGAAQSSEAAAPADAPSLLSPGLARSLFELALLPLLGVEDEAENRGRSAYARWLNV
jgi:hypothetical protein